MKKFFGLLSLLGVFVFFLGSIFYLYSERSSSWKIIINKKPLKKTLKLAEEFRATKKYKQHRISIIAHTATEYVNDKKNYWLLKGIKLTINPISESGLKPINFTLNSQSATFDEEAESIFFLNTTYIYWKKYQMEVKSLTYDLKKNYLVSYNPTKISNFSFIIRSKGVKVFLNTLHLKIFSGVSLLFKNALVDKGIVSETLDYDFKNTFTFNKKVKVFHSTYKGFSDKLIFNKTKKKAQYILMGNVVLSIGGHKFTGERILFNPIDESIEIQDGKIKVDESLNF